MYHYDRITHIVLCGNLFLWSIIALFPQNIFAQRLRHISINEGISQSFVPAIIQTSDGFIWMATSNGLNRYDGEYFINYKKDPRDSLSLASNRISRLFTDQYGFLWIGTDNNINWYNPKNAKFYIPQSAKKSPIQNYSEIYTDSKDGLWMVMRDTMIRYQIYREGPDNEPHDLQQTFHLPVGLNSFTASKNRCFLVTDTAVIIGSGTGTVWSYHLEKQQLTRLPITLTGGVKQIWSDTLFGGIWIQGGNEAVIWKHHQANHLPLSTPDNYSNRRGISVNGLTWVFAGKQIYSWDGATLRQFEQTLPQRILSACTDHQGNIWLGTDTQGVFVMEASGAVFDKIQTGVCHSRPVIIAASGEKWIFNATKLFSEIGTIHPLSDEGVTGRPLTAQKGIMMDVDEQGQIWILFTDKTLGYFKKGSTEVTKINCPFDMSDASRLFCLSNGWVAVTKLKGAIVLYRPQQHHFQLITDAILGSGGEKRVNYNRLWSDKEGRIWVASNIGCFRISCSADGAVAETHPFNPIIQQLTGVEPSEINDLCQDVFNPNLCWLATPDGLIALFTDQTPSRIYTRFNGLPDDYIYSVRSDSNGALWLGTNRGLIAFTPKDGSWRIFTERDGLPANEFNTAAASAAPDGTMFFNTVSGIVRFHPTWLKREANNSPVQITEIIAGETHLFAGKRITLKHDENAVTIHFALLNFIKSEENRYEYQLEGYDDHWVSAGTQNAISYARLAPGTYTFRVRGANSSGVWSEPAEMTIVIRPPWWRTPWMYAVYSALFMLLAGSIFSFWKKMELYRRELLLGEQAQQHQAEMEQFRSRLLANITHEIRTPLTIITGLADRLSKHSDTSVQKEAQSIALSGRELLSLSDQIVELTRLEEDRLPVHYRAGELTGFVRLSLEPFWQLAALKGVQLDAVLPEQLCWAFFDERAIRAMVSNLLSNAIKFTPVGGKVSIVLEIRKHMIHFEIKDSGIGIAPEDHERIFNRFFQVEKNAGYGGSGIGLAYVKELVQRFNGQISVQSRPGDGAVFLIDLPLLTAEPLASRHDTKEQALVTNEQQAAEKPLALLVEDNEVVADYIQSCIEKEYQVFRAAEGEEGLRKAIDLLPDIIITDVMMPGMDGMAFCEAVKHHRLTSHIPVLMLTSLHHPSDRLKGLRKGADAYMSKPFYEDELRLTLHNLQSRRERLKSHLALVLSGSAAAQSLIEEGTPSGNEDQLLVEEEKDFVQAVLAVIDARYTESDFGVAEILKALNVSKAQLHRKMSALTGNTASYYLRKRRLQAACELLDQYPEMNVAQVAFSAGFSDANYFSTVFASEFGMSPRLWRQRGG